MLKNSVLFLCLITSTFCVTSFSAVVTPSNTPVNYKASHNAKHKEHSGTELLNEVSKRKHLQDATHDADDLLLQAASVFSKAVRKSSDNDNEYSDMPLKSDGIKKEEAVGDGAVEDLSERALQVLPQLFQRQIPMQRMYDPSASHVPGYQPLQPATAAFMPTQNLSPYQASPEGPAVESATLQNPTLQWQMQQQMNNPQLPIQQSIQAFPQAGQNTNLALGGQNNNLALGGQTSNVAFPSATLGQSPRQNTNLGLAAPQYRYSLQPYGTNPYETYNTPSSRAPSRRRARQNNYSANPQRIPQSLSYPGSPYAQSSFSLSRSPQIRRMRTDKSRKP